MTLPTDRLPTGSEFVAEAWRQYQRDPKKHMVADMVMRLVDQANRWHPDEDEHEGARILLRLGAVLALLVDERFELWRELGEKDAEPLRRLIEGSVPPITRAQVEQLFGVGPREEGAGT